MVHRLVKANFPPPEAYAKAEAVANIRGTQDTAKDAYVCRAPITGRVLSVVADVVAVSGGGGGGLENASAPKLIRAKESRTTCPAIGRRPPQSKTTKNSNIPSDKKFHEGE